jgi:uncharacterized membrane protein
MDNENRYNAVSLLTYAAFVLLTIGSILIAWGSISKYRRGSAIIYSRRRTKKRIRRQILGGSILIGLSILCFATAVYIS